MAKKLKRVKADALFEGALPDKIPVIDRQCVKLLEAREECGKARLREKEIQNKLIELFHSEEPPLTHYRHEASGKVFKIEAPEKVSYKAAPKPNTDSGSSGDDEEAVTEEKEKMVEA